MHDTDRYNQLDYMMAIILDVMNIEVDAETGYYMGLGQPRFQKDRVYVSLGNGGVSNSKTIYFYRNLLTYNFYIKGSHSMLIGATNISALLGGAQYTRYRQGKTF